jgi:hypothetical protein
MKLAQHFSAGSAFVLERPVPPGTIDERLHSWSQKEVIGIEGTCE